MNREDRELARRCLEFELEREERIADRTEHHGWGRSFLSPTIPMVWDANWILIEQAGMSIAQIVEAADETIGSAGMRHRTVVMLDEADGARLLPEFTSLGWDVERYLYMVWRRAPDRNAGIEVAERRQGEIAKLRRALIEATLPDIGLDTEATVEQLLELDRRVGESDGDRWFIAPARGEPASACRLLARGETGQVEDVATLPTAREQGLARAVTIAAARASKGEGDRLTFLGADGDDWPRLLYAKLGFDEVGRLYGFRLKPSLP